MIHAAAIAVPVNSCDTPRDQAPAIADLTRRLAAGDERAFREFHAQYFDRLYRFLLVVTRGNEHSAQDAVQDTFVRVVRHARVFSSEEVWWDWLKAVARSAAHDVGRKQRRYAALLERFGWSQQNVPEVPLSEPRWHALLQETLAELAPADREIVAGKYLRGETVAELASSTGTTVKAVESRLVRLRRQLAASLLGKLKER